MASKRVLKDDDFGTIVIHPRRLARNITMRVRSDGLHISAPPYCKTEKIVEAIKPFRSRLLERFREIAPRRIDFDFSISAECFHLRFLPGQSKHFIFRKKDDGACIYCPHDADFSSEDVQRLARKAIVRALKKTAEEYLPPLLDVWSERFDLPYKSVRINTARSRWGSCTASRAIRLSCYVMLLPSHLMDYVLLHELAHTKEMNHGPRFWELMNKMTEEQALQLRAELRHYNTDFR